VTLAGAAATDEFAEHEAVVYVTFTTTPADAWRCLERSGLTAGALVGETLIRDIELVRPESE
jgi:hypothetical protein